MVENLPLKPPPKRVTVVESIIEQIVSLIQNETLKPGDKLPSEHQLMEMLGVSRSSVREALQGLAAMDLVEGRAGEGTFVKEFRRQLDLGPDISTLSTSLQREMRHHLNQARLLLERGIVVAAAEQINESSREAIMRALEEYEAYRQFVSEESGWPAHDQVHLAIAEATGNPILVRILQTLLDLVPQTLRDKGLMHGSPDEIARRVETERHIHRRLCEAIARGDAAAASEWMERHAESERQVIDEYYGSLSRPS